LVPADVGAAYAVTALLQLVETVDLEELDAQAFVLVDRPYGLWWGSWVRLIPVVDMDAQHGYAADDHECY